MQKSYRKALVPFGELVMFMPVKKPKDKGEVRNRVGIMVGLVDRSDEVVIGTTERVVKGGTVRRMPAGQRGDAVYVKSIRGVPWQPNPAEVAEGEPLGVAQTRIVRVPLAAGRAQTGSSSHGAEGLQSPSVLYPTRCGAREARAKPHSGGCRERIRQAMMNDDVGQQRLHMAEQRVSPAGGQLSVPRRVEAAQVGPDGAMRQAPPASSARNVKPRADVTWEDSTGVSGRMERTCYG